MTYLDTPVDSDLQKSLQSALDLNSSFNRQLREKDAQFSSVKDIILEAFDVDEFVTLSILLVLPTAVCLIVNVVFAVPP